MKTDGTLAGTSQVKLTGTLPQTPQSFISINGKMVFTASTTANGKELWVTDGSDAGTFMLKDINSVATGSISPIINNMVLMNGYIFFKANDGTNGSELWKTDGTTLNTIMVKNINTAAASGSDPTNLTNVNGVLFFFAADITSGRELWKSDGSAAGTVLVKDISIGTSSTNFSAFCANGSILYFGNETSGIWKSDDTTAGTVAVKTGLSNMPNMINISGVIYFSATQASTGDDVWKSDGTSTGTVILKDLTTSSHIFEQFKNVNGVLMFVQDYEVWRSDGTGTGTYLIKEISTYGIVPDATGSDPRSLTISNNKLFFSGHDPKTGPEPYVSDGSTLGTTMLKNIGTNTPSSITANDQIVVGANMYFFAVDSTFQTDTYNYELWKTNATSVGTVMVKNACSWYSTFSSFIEINGTIFYKGGCEWSSNFPDELWKSDGTALGTIMVKDIKPGWQGSNPTDFIVMGNILYFTANDGVNGQELWRSDGTNAGTYMVKDINTSGDGTWGGFTVMNVILYFSANSGSTLGYELWRSDGTSLGTYLVKDIYSGAQSGAPYYLKLFNGELYFSADNGINGRELWKTNGTAIGTVMVKDLLPGVAGSSPEQLFVFNNSLFFAAYSVSEGLELWKSDGTSAGTSLLKDITPGIFSSTFGNFTKSGNLMYFGTNFSEIGTLQAAPNDLWRSDGTAEGKYLLKSFSGHGRIGLLTPYQNSLFFRASTPSFGQELWKTDGTTTATVMVTDFTAGSGGGVSFIGILGSSLLVAFNSPEFGSELYTASFASVLPISALEFNGQLKNNNGELFWKTSNEINSYSFEVERSTNGRNFKFVGTVNATNTSGHYSYAFTDSSINKLGVPVVYYRLKQKDTDGHFTYSSILLLQLAKSSSKLLLYPNPVRQTLQITVSTGLPERIQINMYDQGGRKLQHQQQQLSAGSNALSLDVKALPAGTYYLELKGTGVNERKMFIKQ